MKKTIEMLLDFSLNPQNYMSYEQFVSNAILCIEPGSAIPTQVSRPFMGSTIIFKIDGADIHPSLASTYTHVVHWMLAKYGKTDTEFYADWVKEHDTYGRGGLCNE